MIDGSIPLRPLMLNPLPLEVPPFGETPFEEMVLHYCFAMSGKDCDEVLLHGARSLSAARAAMLAAGELGLSCSVAFVCDENGEMPAGGDVLAALIVMEGMGVKSFGLCCSKEVAEEQLARIASCASMPLFWMEGEERHEFTYTMIPHDPDVIPCAGCAEARFITADVDMCAEIECSPDLLEDIICAEDEPGGALKIMILEEDDLDIFAEHQYAVRDALCLWADVPELMEKALRLYQGRAFYDGTGDLEDDFLQEMTRKYGLVVL